MTAQNETLSTKLLLAPNKQFQALLYVNKLFLYIFSGQFLHLSLCVWAIKGF
jgi:hypothetical protein